MPFFLDWVANLIGAHAAPVEGKEELDGGLKLSPGNILGADS